MSKVLVTESYLIDISNAIRSKNGSSTKYKPSEMAAAIKAITTGNVVTQLDSVTLTNQYIDTGITPEPGYTYEFKLKTADTSSDWYALFGTRLSDGDSRCFGIVQVPGTAGQVRFDFDYTDTNTSSTQVNFGTLLSGGATISFTGNGTSLTVAPTSGSSQSFTKKAISSSSTTGLTASVYLGAYHRQDIGAAIFKNSSITFYSVKITNGSALVANFTPASYNGVNGMYESVKNKFHGVDGKITNIPTQGSQDNTVLNSILDRSISGNYVNTDLTEIGQSAFNLCDQLTSATFQKVTKVNGSAFSSCRSLESISLPEVKEIEQSAFAYCSSLKSISMPKIEILSNDNSYWGIFNYCEMTTINIPSTIQSIGKNAFESSKITTINIDKPADSISGAPWGATGATVNWTGTT